MTWQRAAVFCTVLQVLIGREAKGTGLHGLIEDLFHLVQLGVGHCGALPRGDHAKDIATHRGEGHQGTNVDTQPLPIQTIEVLREGDPVPAHAELH